MAYYLVFDNCILWRDVDSFTFESSNTGIKRVHGSLHSLKYLKKHDPILDLDVDFFFPAMVLSGNFHLLSDVLPLYTSFSKPVIRKGVVQNK